MIATLLALLFALASPLLADWPAPDWARDAIWYQVFVERFDNGDSSNDPTQESAHLAWPHEKAPAWSVTSWDHDWYKPDPWVRPEDGDFYTWVHHRRYGGDLQGLINRLDHLESLGITAIYLNPVNDAPSLHKYDARNWRHVDVNFGPDPEGDRQMIAAEDPADPASWQWTSADRLFLELVAKVHARGMRIILDYSWNHTGLAFWAFQDIREHQERSRYKDWFVIHSFDDPATEEDEFDYEGWAGIRELPAVTQINQPDGVRGGLNDGTLHPEVRDHVFAVTQRWLDPDGDGNPEDGIDGYRLDVAEQVPVGFWREYRRFVKAINPQALLVGEIWWEHWPLEMMDPKPWLEVFDSVMHYQWYMPVRSFMAETPPWYTPAGLTAELDSMQSRLPEDRRLALMNLVASHDSPRFATSIANRGRYKFHVSPRENSSCHLSPPTRDDLAVMAMIRVQQFTWPGAPHIWNGDEFGMWGADDPDNRKPVLWPERSADKESWRPWVDDGLYHGQVSPIDARPDLKVLEGLETLAHFRRKHARLFSEGEIEWIESSDQAFWGYVRRLGPEVALVLFNRGWTGHELDLPEGDWQLIIDSSAPDLIADNQEKSTLEPRSARVYMLR